MGADGEGSDLGGEPGLRPQKLYLVLLCQQAPVRLSSRGLGTSYIELT